jgi:Tfp pilus assembly protein PilW
MRVQRWLHRRSRADDGGTSLIEVVITMAVFTAVMATVFQAMISSNRLVNDIDSQVRGQADARLVIDRFSRDLRQAYTGSTANVLATMTSTEVSYYSPDRSTPMRLRRITYRLDTATRTLQRGETLSAGMTLPAAPTTFVTQLTAVSSPTVFTYQLASGLTATDPTKVRTVTLALAIDDPTSKVPGTQEYLVTVALRDHRQTASP